MKEYVFSDLKVGQIERFTKTIKKDDLIIFSKLTGDSNPLHLNENYAKTTKFKQPIVFGYLVQSYLSTLAGMYLPGRYCLILKTESNFRKPIFLEDNLTISGEVINKINSKNIIILETKITNNKKELVLNGKLWIEVLK